jgi:RNA polymerase sigma-70 factor (ECF subfamily)
VELLRDPDADLVARCRQPESDDFEAAFEELYLKYRDRVYAIAFRVTGSSVDAMDVVQECFSLVFRKLDGFRSDSLFSTWLFRIVVNCSIDHRRRERSKAMDLVGGDAEFDAEDPASGPGQRAETRELGDQVQQAMARLSPKLRAVLALRYLENMAYEDLAATLAVSLGTVKSRLARAHLALEKVVRSSFPWLYEAIAGEAGAREQGGQAGKTGGVA